MPSVNNFTNLVILLGALLCIASILTMLWWGENWRKKTRVTTSTLLLLTGITGVTSALFYEFPSGSALPATFDEDGNITYHPNGLLVFEWSKDYVNIPRKPIGLTSSVKTITDNPKVREVEYSTQIKIEDPGLFYSKPERRHKTSGQALDGGTDFDIYYLHWTPSQDRDGAREIATVVGSYLYKFNDKHSKELATLNDPLDPSQLPFLQATFAETAKLIREHEGLRVEVTRFNLK